MLLQAILKLSAILKSEQTIILPPKLFFIYEVWTKNYFRP